MKFRSRFLFLVLAALAVLVFTTAFTPLAQPAPQVTQPPALDLTTFHQWLIGCGGSILAVSRCCLCKMILKPRNQ